MARSRTPFVARRMRIVPFPLLSGEGRCCMRQAGHGAVATPQRGTERIRSTIEDGFLLDSFR